MERAIADINEMCPDIVICSGDLTTFGFKEEYAQAKRYLDRLDVRVVRGHPGEPRLAQRRLRPLREPLRQPQLGAAQERHHASWRSTRPSPTSTTARSAAAATRWIEEQFVGAGRHADLRAPPPPAAGAGHGPRAEHRLRRRRRDRVPPARGCEPRPFGAQACPVCLAAREPVRRQHRHGLVPAPPGRDAALLQRDRGHAARTSRSGAAIRSTVRSASSSSTSRRSSTRSTPGGSRER